MDANIELTPAGLLVSEIISASRIFIDGNTELSAVEFPHLASVALVLYFTNNTNLQSLSLPVLTSTAAGTRSGIRVNNCPALANVNLASFLPANFKQMTFTGCALTEAAVDHILARCVASTSFVHGSINLSGGTSAPPSAAGVADKATLIARGVNAITN